MATKLKAKARCAQPKTYSQIVSKIFKLDAQKLVCTGHCQINIVGGMTCDAVDQPL
jgi:hypothetical protein